MAIKGSLREASLPDVLQLLALGQKTGCLSISDRTSFGYIYFDRGRICFASIVNRRDRLGDILVKNGVITPEALGHAVDEQTRHHRRLGEILVDQGALSADALRDHVRIQIEEAVFYLFTWTHGTFSFEAEVRPEEQTILVSINPESLLLEGARRVDEWSLIEKKVPGFDVIFEVDRARLDTRASELAAEERRLVPLIDGRRDVAALVDESGLGEFDVGKALYGLATAGLIHRAGRSRPAEVVARQARVEEHRNLGVAFYKAGMYEEAAREFRRVAELLPNDMQALFFLALVHSRSARWEDAEAILREAVALPNAKPAVFHNLAYVLERMGRYDEAIGALEDAVRHGGADDAQIRTSLGVLALKRGQAEKADVTLSAARAHCGKRPPSAAWYHYAALAAAVLGDLDRALALATEGGSTHPHSAPLQNLLATIYERRGEYSAAIQAAERGLAEDVALHQLHKNLGDCHYRAGRYDNAIEAYGRALKLDPSFGGDVHFKLGNIHYKRHQKLEAVECWERALALDPGNELVRTNLDLVRTVLA
ncbi:MAG: tetratricopeptide repeat protein [Gemmatimonadota bacterium]|nr:tetratricopeptide repeat protein [Gemmatimonadota bacterium]